MGEPAINGGFDKIGRKECKRDCHVDFADAALLSLRNAFCICFCVGEKFVKPTAAPGNRCDQRRTGFRPYGTNMLRRESHRCKDLPPPRRWCLVPRDMKGVVSSI